MFTIPGNVVSTFTGAHPQNNYFYSAVRKLTVLKITTYFSIPDAEIELSAIRAQGTEGPHGNNVYSALHLRFAIHAFLIAFLYKQLLLYLQDRRINKEGVINIKAQQYRIQEKNRDDALVRLQEIIKKAIAVQKIRKPTKPSMGSKKRRLDSKTKRGKTKALRSRIF